MPTLKFGRVILIAREGKYRRKRNLGQQEECEDTYR